MKSFVQRLYQAQEYSGNIEKGELEMNIESENTNMRKRYDKKGNCKKKELLTKMKNHCFFRNDIMNITINSLSTSDVIMANHKFFYLSA